MTLQFTNAIASWAACYITGFDRSLAHAFSSVASRLAGGAEFDLGPIVKALEAAVDTVPNSEDAAVLLIGTQDDVRHSTDTCTQPHRWGSPQVKTVHGEDGLDLSIDFSFYFFHWVAKAREE